MTIHCRLVGVKCKRAWIEGKATFTIVASSTTMNWARQTSTSTSQRFGSDLTTYLSSPDDDRPAARYRSGACSHVSTAVVRVEVGTNPSPMLM